MGFPASSRLGAPDNGRGEDTEIGRLLTAYAQSVALYSAAVGALREIQRKDSPEAAFSAFRDADRAHRRCEQVRLAVQMYFGKKTV